jgi:hypothetical protein
MRPIRQPVQTLGFIAGQPPVQCLTRHPVFSAAWTLASFGNVWAVAGSPEAALGIISKFVGDDGRLVVGIQRFR